MFTRSILIPVIILLVITCLPWISCAQENQDVRQSMHMVTPSYSINQPFFDLKNRFGLTHTVGAGYSILFKNNWIVNAEGNFLFGKNIKEEDKVLKNIATSDGHIIDQGGTYAQVALSERGYTVWLKAGKLFTLGKPDKTSGILWLTGVGMMQHKIRIDVSQNSAPQLRKEYKKGYDHMCNGPALTEFIGYQFIQESKRINCFAGLEFTCAWTQSRRAYYFTEMIKPDEKRFDMLTGIKVGWIIPINRKTGHEYYYY